jgi:CheY-like chemotaxis protein
MKWQNSQKALLRLEKFVRILVSCCVRQFTMFKKVLVVDDDAHIREIAQMSLEDDFEVIMASSGNEAILLSEKLKPDFILLDRMMPEMDGIMTLKRLRESPELAKIPVIFLTAKVQKHEMDSYAQYKVAGVIAKPFDPMTLPAEILELLHQQIGTL